MVTFARLPRTDRGNRQAQLFAKLLQRDFVLAPPRGERGRKAGADVALEVRLFGHGSKL